MIWRLPQGLRLRTYCLQLTNVPRLVADSFGRRPRHKLLTGAALALGMGVVTAALSVALDVGDRLAKEFRSLGANLVVTPKADSLPLEIGGVDYRPVNAGAYLPEADLPKLKAIFWHNNIVAFAPILESTRYFGFFEPQRPFRTSDSGEDQIFDPRDGSWVADSGKVQVIGTWVNHGVTLPDGSTFVTGVESTNPWWAIQGRWFREKSGECVIGTRLAQRLDIHIGDKLIVEYEDKKAAPVLTVTGTVSTGS